ncbi:MAG: hypothetical protein F4Z75_07810, partial [Synechococcus sp. SB0668_bin_15]|nr:hypothetical protein [Synechococcus sp. SB0668_bin_15]
MRSPSAPWRRYLGCLPLALGLATKQPRRPPANTCTTGGPGGAFFLAPLLALPFLALALEAAAQTTVTFTSNLGQMDGNSVAFGFGNLVVDNAQAFTTGSNALGYTLYSVEMEFVGSGSPFSATATIRNSSGSNPGSTIIGTLTSPTFPAIIGNEGKVLTFTTTGIDLDPNTTYFFVLDVSQPHSQTGLRSTAASAEDTGGTTGWSIADGRVSYISNNWHHSNTNPLKIRLKGVINNPLALTPASPTVKEGESGSFKVKLKEDPGSNATMTIRSTASEVTVSPATLTFTTGNWNSYQTVTVKASHDNNHNNERPLRYTFSGGVTVSDLVLPTTVIDDEHNASPVVTFREDRRERRNWQHV